MLAKHSIEASEPGQAIRLIGIDSAHAFGTHRDILIVVWRGETRPAAVTHVARSLRELSAHYPAGVGLLQIAEVSTSPPDSEARLAITQMLKGAEGIVVCSSLVYEGTGFWMAAARAFVTGLTMLSRPGFPHVVFSTAEEAAEWHSRLLSDPGTSRDGILAGVDALVFALDEHGPSPSR